MTRQNETPRGSSRSTQIQATGNFLVYKDGLTDTEKDTCLDLQTAVRILRESMAGGVTVRGLFALSEKMAAGSFGIFLSNEVLGESKGGRVDTLSVHTKIFSELKARKDTMITHGRSYAAELQAIKRRTFPNDLTPVIIEMVPEHLLRLGFTSRSEELAHFIGTQTSKPCVVPREWRR